LLIASSVVGGILDADELDAVRQIMADAYSPAARADANVEPSEARPVALIADDRACRIARPDALRIAGRWTASARTKLIRGVGVKLEVRVEGVDVVAGARLREDVEGTWTRVVAVTGRSGLALLSVGGAMVEGMAAVLLGGDPEAQQEERERPPSLTALGVFSRAGELVVAALSEAWREEQGSEVRIVADTQSAENWKNTLYAAESLIAISLGVAGNTSGRIRLIGPPEAFLAPPPALSNERIMQQVMQDVLAPVLVELRVELGRAQITMGALTMLEPGDVITLDRATDEPLPVFVADAQKAHGRPIITRGLLGVEVVKPDEEEK
jgi:flagellar motor switch protein FliM